MSGFKGKNHHDKLMEEETSMSVVGSLVRDKERPSDKQRNEDKPLITTDDTIDFISKIPLPILHHILGFLLAEDAARVAVLSKTWSEVWDTLPFLDFGSPGRSTKFNEVLPYVDKILGLHKNLSANVQKFSYGNRHCDKFASSVECWIKTLKDLHVSDLCLRYYNGPNVTCTLPEALLSIKSISSLELRGFNLDAMCGADAIKWLSLRKLHLSYSFVSDDVIHNIVSNCLAIEDLILECCFGFNNVKISKLVRLRNFELRVNVILDIYPKVEINVPSLESLRYDGANIQDPFNVTLGACVMLKTLKLYSVGITQGWFDKLLSLFPLLESLTVNLCYMLVKVNLSSFNLKFLFIKEVKPIEVYIDAPNLSTFHYDGYGVSLFSINASPRLQVYVELYQKLDINTVERAKFANFFRMIGHSEFVTVGCAHERLSFSKEVRDELIYSRCDLKNFLLHFRTHGSSELTIDAAIRLIDNILWFYSRLEKLSIFADEDNHKACLKVLFEQLSYGEKKPNCCGDSTVKCWRHFLEDVKLETPESDETKRHKFYSHYDINQHKILRISLKPRE